jgi:hypothetical protein
MYIFISLKVKEWRKIGCEYKWSCYRRREKWKRLCLKMTHLVEISTENEDIPVCYYNVRSYM